MLTPSHRNKWRAILKQFEDEGATYAKASGGEASENGTPTRPKKTAAKRKAPEAKKGAAKKVKREATDSGDDAGVSNGGADATANDKAKRAPAKAQVKVVKKQEMEKEASKVEEGVEKEEDSEGEEGSEEVEGAGEGDGLSESAADE